jgi:hypothetical protein
VRANGKFGGIDAGPDRDWEEGGEALGEVVRELKAR